MGLFIIVGAQVGGRLTAHFGPTRVVRVGLALEAVGLAMMAYSIAPGMSFLAVLPSLVVFGIGIGFASSQLTSVVLTEIDAARAGAASGANTTVRQIGSALGVAIAASLFVTTADPADGARLALLRRRGAGRLRDVPVVPHPDHRSGARAPGGRPRERRRPDRA